MASSRASHYISLNRRRTGVVNQAVARSSPPVTSVVMHSLASATLFSIGLVIPALAGEPFVGTHHSMERVQVNGYELRNGFGLWTSSISGKNYTLSIAAHGNVMPAMIWLDEVERHHADSNGDGHVDSTVIIRATQRIAPSNDPVAIDADSCHLKSSVASVVVASVTYREGKKPILHEAWRLDLDNERFAPVAVRDLECRPSEPVGE